MRTHIDWISFTLDIPQEPKDSAHGEFLARQALKSHSDKLYNLIVGFDTVDYHTGRSPYIYGYHVTHGDARFYIGSNTMTVLFELPGKWCSKVTQIDGIKAVLRSITGRVTRIDVATDMETKITPSEFANSRVKARKVSVGFQSSTTGETVYLGSQKSERFCRIYRYAPPHPRSDDLRFEAVYRRDYAKALASAILDAKTWTDLAKFTGDPYDFQAPAWDVKNVSGIDLTLPRAERKDENTVAWIYRSCVPAIARMIREGAIDADSFWRAVEDKL